MVLVARVCRRAAARCGAACPHAPGTARCAPPRIRRRLAGAAASLRKRLVRTPVTSAFETRPLVTGVPRRDQHNISPGAAGSASARAGRILPRPRTPPAASMWHPRRPWHPCGIPGGHGIHVASTVTTAPMAPPRAAAHVTSPVSAAESGETELQSPNSAPLAGGLDDPRSAPRPLHPPHPSRALPASPASPASRLARLGPVRLTSFTPRPAQAHPPHPLHASPTSDPFGPAHPAPVTLPQAPHTGQRNETRGNRARYPQLCPADGGARRSTASGRPEYARRWRCSALEPREGRASS